MTKDQIHRAGQLIKILTLAGSPGMDRVAIKLNSGLTYPEQEQAELWAKAFELAQKRGDLFDLAAELHKSRR